MNNNDKIKKNYKELYNFIESGKCSNNNYNSLQEPFFKKNDINNPKIDYNILEINNIIQDINMPNKLKIIYQIIGNNNIEFYFNNWTLLSLNKANEIYQNFKKQNQHQIYDFAIRYIGMGHVIVASINLHDMGILYRSDGGSNGYEREDNYNFIINYKPEISNITFDNWIEETKNIEKGPFEYTLINR